MPRASAVAEIAIAFALNMGERLCWPRRYAMLSIQEILDLSQTAAILVQAVAIVWAIRLVRMEMRASTSMSQAVSQSLHAVLEGMEALRQRVRDLEEQQALMRKAGKRPPAP